MNGLTEEERRAQVQLYVDRGIFEQIARRAHSHAVPLIWRNRRPSRQVDANSIVPAVGSGVLLQEGESVVGVTAGHVLAEYLRERARRPGLALRVGSIPVERLEDFMIEMCEGPMDLATFRCDRRVVSQGHAIPAYRLRERVREGDWVFLGGFRRENVRLEKRDAFADFAHLFTKVSRASETQFTMRIRTGRPSDVGPWIPVPPNFGMAGASGGPVFRVKEGLIGGRHVFELEVAGVMYEYLRPQPDEDGVPTGTVVARYIDAVEPSGRLRDEPMVLSPRLVSVGDFESRKRSGGSGRARRRG